MVKNRIHAILAVHGISVDATDAFGKKGIMRIEERSRKSTLAESAVMNDIWKESWISPGGKRRWKTRSHSR